MIYVYHVGGKKLNIRSKQIIHINKEVNEQKS